MNIDLSTCALADVDAFYAALLRAHEGLSEDDSNTLNAQMVLLLANQVADPAILLACIDAARAALAVDRAGAAVIRQAGVTDN